MLLTITTTYKPATDLGYLLVKKPDRVHSRSLSFGEAHVFYPEAGEGRCTAALLLEVDSLKLVRGSKDKGERTLAHYVNDRPYVASSFLSVAMARVFGSTLGGRNKGREELAKTPIPLEARLPALPCRGGEPFLTSLFEPLGYDVAAERLPLDEAFPDWGDSPYYRVRLSATCCLSEMLNHLYVLLPVLDRDKHYWMGKDEVDKLLAKGEGWLKDHPRREDIVRRYMGRRRSLAREALARLVMDDDPEPDETAEAQEAEEEALEEKISLNERRYLAVLEALKESGARSVVDLGCGEGKLLKRLYRERSFDRVAGMDASTRSLEIAARRVYLDRMTERQRERIELFQGALTYRDKRVSDYDAACLVEVIEHLDPPRLPALERAIFGYAKPRIAVVTTPNREYNANFEGMKEGALRHRDHRFEWTRAEFRDWAEGVATRAGYAVRFVPIGDEDDKLGPPTQMAVFSR
jgi:3' terminal RNA ribose 2'-O-methyltransferase Hen1